MGNKHLHVPTLVQKLTDPSARPAVVRACVELIEGTVASKGGLTGVAIRGAYKIVRSFRPGFVAHVVDNLLPEFAEALEPFHARSMELAEQSERPRSEIFSTHLTEHRAEAAESLLAVTDRRAETAKNRAMKKAYERLRGSAGAHVSAAVPDLARTIGPFV